MFQLTEKSQIPSYIRDQSQIDSSNVLRLIDPKIFAYWSPVLVSNSIFQRKWNTVLLWS